MCFLTHMDVGTTDYKRYTSFHNRYFNKKLIVNDYINIYKTYRLFFNIE
jgi:hypothetical protein